MSSASLGSKRRGHPNERAERCFASAKSRERVVACSNVKGKQLGQFGHTGEGPIDSTADAPHLRQTMASPMWLLPFVIGRDHRTEPFSKTPAFDGGFFRGRPPVFDGENLAPKVLPSGRLIASHDDDSHPSVGFFKHDAVSSHGFTIPSPPSLGCLSSGGQLKPVTRRRSDARRATHHRPLIERAIPMTGPPPSVAPPGPPSFGGWERVLIQPPTPRRRADARSTRHRLQPRNGQAAPLRRPVAARLMQYLQTHAHVWGVPLAFLAGYFCRWWGQR